MLLKHVLLYEKYNAKGYISLKEEFKLRYTWLGDLPKHFRNYRPELRSHALKLRRGRLRHGNLARARTGMMLVPSRYIEKV